MSEKRFTIKPQDEYWAVVDNYNGDKVCIINGIHTEMEAIWLCDFMNEQQSTIQSLKEENEQLKQKIQRWKTLYEIKDKEVTARVDSLNKVCEYYTSEVLFKSDVDPNKAVKEVINRILNTEVANDE